MTKVDQQEKHSRYENGTVNLNPETKMFNNRFKFDAAADLAKSILEADVKTKMEALKGDQEKLDKNRNGKLDAQDFKILRGEKKTKEEGWQKEDVNEAEANYQSSYRVGKTANFKPKASDVGQGRKITGKMGKYGKQPDDDNMVEPPPEHKVGDVKTDPSAVVPGHSTMGAKLHLASLPKDAEGNTIHKGARRVNAADLVAKRKAMMAGQKNEEVEEIDEAKPSRRPDINDLISRDEKVRAERLKQRTAEYKQNFKDIQKGRKHPKFVPKNEEVESIEEGMEDTLHPAGAALLKHIKPEHHNLYKPHLTKDVFNGGFGDRHAVLKAAHDAGHLKMALNKQNEEVEPIIEGKMDKMTLSGLWHKHAQHSYMADQGYGHGEGGMKNNEHAATAIENHVRKHYGNKVADDMISHSDHHVAHAEYAGPESAPHHEKEAEKLRKKHGIVGSLYGESVEHVNERTLTPGETAEKEKIVHGMKKSLKGFKARYGDRAKEVMYATATKQAKKD